MNLETVIGILIFGTIILLLWSFILDYWFEKKEKIRYTQRDTLINGYINEVEEFYNEEL